MEHQIFTQTSPSFWVKVHALLGVDGGGSLIVH